MDQTFMKEKKILPLVLSMSLPMVLSMLVNSLFNIVDSFFVAKVSEDAMTALSLVYPVQLVLTAVSVGFGVGVNVLIAYLLGAKEKKRADHAASCGVLLGLVHGMMIIIVCRIGMKSFLGLFTKNSDVVGLGMKYANIAFLFSAIVTVGITYEKIFQAVGRMKETMVSMLVGFISNIILDPLMIFGIGPFPKMGIEGAALATGIGQTLTLLSYIIYYFVKPLPVKINIENICWEGDLVKRMYSVGIPATLNMALSSVLLAIINAILSVYGDACVLVFGAYYKLQSFIYLPSGGVIQGIRPIIGYNHGAGEKKRVRSIFITALVMTLVIMAVGMLLCLIVPGWLMSLFTANGDKNRNNSAQDNKPWICSVSCFRDMQRCTGRIRKRCSIIMDITHAVYNCHNTNGIYIKPCNVITDRCMDCISGNRIYRSSSVGGHLQKAGKKILSRVIVHT